MYSLSFVGPHTTYIDTGADLGSWDNRPPPLDIKRKNFRDDFYITYKKNTVKFITGFRYDKFERTN